MEPTLEERDFFDWILSDKLRCTWDFDKNGQRLKMVPGWEKAEAEYKRIQGIREKSENGLKVSRIPYSIE
jgi:hypothetical protein